MTMTHSGGETAAILNTERDERNKRVLELVGLVRRLAWSDEFGACCRDDLIQEGMVAAIRAADRYRPGPASLGTYARLRILKAMREWRRREWRGVGEDIHGMEDMVEDPSTDVRAVVDGRALRGVLDGALSQLTARQREVLTLRYGLDGRGSRAVAEVAAGLGCSAGSVRVTERTALRRLRNPNVNVELWDMVMVGAE